MCGIFPFLKTMDSVVWRFWTGEMPQAKRHKQGFLP
jgi:hypothetical protein